jgi:hypothetical protein
MSCARPRSVSGHLVFASSGRVRAALAVALTLAAVLAAAAWPAPARAADTWSDPYPGVRYLFRTTSEPNRIHAVFIDLCARGVSAHATRPSDRGIRTSTFAGRAGVQIAINAGFYNTSNYAPIGLTMGEGERWTDSADSSTTGFVAFGQRNRSELSTPSLVVSSPADWMTDIVSGFPLLVDGGQVIQEACFSHMCERHPRTAIGFDATGRTAILVVVDGRWTGVSRGMTRLELAALMVDLGAVKALNMDGGGSSTLYIAGLGGVVNRPSDGSERAVSNHLGFTAGGSTDFARCCIPAPVAGATGVFADIPDTHWAKEAAETLFALGITSGCQASPRLFCPSCLVTRGQAAKLMASGMGLPDRRPATPTFSDVPATHSFYGAIEALVAAGYIGGCATSPARFCPDDDLTRAQAAVLATRMIGADGLSVSPPSFSDCPAGAWYTPFVERVRDACIATGCNPAARLFCPEDPATRAEFALILVKSLELGSFTNCYDGGCTASCAGRVCGSDGCGGSCGTCPAGQTCTAAGQCQSGSTCTPDAAEPDSASNPSPLAPGQTRAHSLCPAGDEDWWRFTLPTPADVVLTTSGSSGDTRMWLMDAAQNEIAYDDDGGDALFSRIQRTALPAGTYLVKVDEYGDDAPIDAYTITLTTVAACVPQCGGRICGPDGCGGSCGTCGAGAVCNAAGLCEPDLSCTPDAWEPDDSPAQAAPITPGATHTRSICPIGDEDWWRFTLLAAADVTLETAGAAGDTRLWLLGPDGAELGYDDDGGTNAFSRLTVANVPAGTWYVRVDEFGDNDPIATYSLTLTVSGVCAPQCAGRTCGPDGCGGSCGTCPAGRTCTDAGACVVQCVRDCTALECGPDGCGGSCGACPAGEHCDLGRCVSDCAAACGGRACGDDGCGGSCGTCGAGAVCVAGRCITDCRPDCAGRQCGPDGCGGLCGSCAAGESCLESRCVGACTPACGGRTCGSDGCGGSCGTCPAGWACVNGTCSDDCAPACTNRECGDDGCGGSCGTCGAGERCVGGSCTSGCTPSCAGRQCGDDGCSGTCGACFGGTHCVNGNCLGDCTPTCAGRECGDDGCAGLCGECPPGWSCAEGTCVEGCAPDCRGRECGDDGCGGSCGACGSGWECDPAGLCQPGCVPQCAGRDCGDDGCGATCGTCGPELTCSAQGRCVGDCVPQCAGRACGTDGCGGTCGACGLGSTCDPQTGRCLAGCVPDCEGRFCGDDGCGGSCGACAPGLVCHPSGACIYALDQGGGGGDAAGARDVTPGTDEGAPYRSGAGGCAASPTTGAPAALAALLLAALAGLLSFAGARRRSRAAARRG